MTGRYTRQVMAQYAERIAALPIVQVLKASAGRDQISQTEVDQLHGLILNIADAAGPLLSRVSHTFSQYTEHDIGHCRNLLDLCGRFIPPATLEQLNAVELALLISAILLHDFGMFVSEDEKITALESPEFGEYIGADTERQEAIDRARLEGRSWDADYLRDAALAEYFRRVHPERAADNIHRHIEFPLTFREMDLSRDIARLSESHGWAVHEPLDLRHPEKVVRELPVQQPIYGIPVNLQYLACCLRLADIMDFDRSRTPVSVFKAMHFSEDRSRAEWNKHLQITGWQITPKEAMYVAECTRPAFYVSVMEFLSFVEREIQNCKRLLSQAPEPFGRYRLELSPLVDRSRIQMQDRSYLAGGYRFELDDERIMALLMDRSLYADPSLFIRELLQNSADACRFRASLAAEAESRYRPRIVVTDQEIDGIRRISVQDNGIGMSLEVLLNYFLRVGRSFYRSRDFLAARSRLAGAGIELDATSSFGIGILSCFMVCDNFTVETYRRGHKPLVVTVEGATKYFVIQQLPEPERPDFESQMETDEGPPHQPGTRLTLSITKVKDFDVVSVIESTAVNLEYEVTVVRPTGERLTIPADGWQLSPLSGDRQAGIGKSHMSLTAVRWELAEKTWSEPYHRSILDVLIPSTIPFSSHAGTQSYRGAAWIWMLRDSAGHPVPAQGYLRIREHLELKGAPAFLGKLIEQTKAKHVVYPDLQTLGRLLRDDIDSGKLAASARDYVHTLYCEAEDEDQDPDDLTEQMADTWEALSVSERSLVATSLLALTDSAHNWLTIPNFAERLRLGEMDWATQSINFSGKLRFNGLPQKFATFGMLLPGGILRWDPKAGFARKVCLLDGAMGARVDFRGPHAPRPAASRLFVEAAHAEDAAVSVIRALIAHSASLVTVGATPSWKSWFRSFLRTSARLPFWRRAIFEELETIERLAVYKVSENYLTGAEVRERMGRWVVVESDDFRQVQIGRWGLNAILLGLKERRSSGEIVEVDFESALAPQPDVFEPDDSFYTL
jgi:hypothetical protein